MASRYAWLLCLAAVSVKTQSASEDVISYTQSIVTATASISTQAFTGSQYTYLSADSQSTISSSSLFTISGSNSSSTSTTDSQITRTTKSHSLTNLVGGAAATGTNATATSTTSSVQATNTVPCNNYPEFCSRKYSNITEVCAHNSAFAIKSNAGSNQALPIINQLDDGIRMRMYLMLV